MKKIIKAILFMFVISMSSVYAETVNLNTATKAELMTLKGIGEARAEAIMKYRRSTKFSTPADIKNVNGIGDEIYKSNSRKMKVTGSTSVKAKAKKAVSKNKPKEKSKAKKDVAKEKAKAKKAKAKKAKAKKAKAKKAKAKKAKAKKK